MQAINYLVIGVMLLTIGLFIFLVYFSFTIFYLEKVRYFVKNKKIMRKRQPKKYRVKIEKLLKGYQLVIGSILILLLLIIGMILKVEIYVNQLLQSNYDQKQLEKKLRRKINC